MKYIELNGLKLYLPSSVSVEKGKKAYDYSANWSMNKNGAVLKGKEYRYAKGSEEHKLIRQLVWEKYWQQYRPAANADCKLIDEERALDYLNTPTPNCKVSGVSYGKGQLTLVNPEEIRVSSYEISLGLGLKHRPFITLITKHSKHIEEFGALFFEKTEIEGAFIKVYFLNREQSEFVCTLSRNTQQVIAFKKWIVKKFNELKGTKLYSPEFQSFGTCMSNRAESIVQQMLVQLASYTSTPLKQEVIINEDYHRVDLMASDNSIAIELKTHLITPAHIKRTIFEKNYYHSIKKKFPSFQTLIFSSTVGINEEAREMIKHNNPYIIYQSIPELANRFIKDSNRRELADKFQYLLQAA